MTEPKYPVYDPAKDGNKFEWILAQALTMRENQQHAAHSNRPNIDYLSGKPKQPAGNHKP